LKTEYKFMSGSAVGLVIGLGLCGVSAAHSSAAYESLSIVGLILTLVCFASLVITCIVALVNVVRGKLRGR
jgi:tellurite resistance protein TehA-like permease